jgi:hypothetical protein
MASPVLRMAMGARHPVRAAAAKAGVDSVALYFGCSVALNLALGPLGFALTALKLPSWWRTAVRWWNNG